MEVVLFTRLISDRQEFNVGWRIFLCEFDILVEEYLNVFVRFCKEI